MRVRISNENIASVDIFGNVKKVNAEIVTSNHEESIVCVRIWNRNLRKIGVFCCFFVRILNRIAHVKKFSYTQTYSISLQKATKNTNFS